MCLSWGYDNEWYSVQILVFVLFINKTQNSLNVYIKELVPGEIDKVVLNGKYEDEICTVHDDF